MTEPTLLAIDLGTTALKCALYTVLGEPVGEITREYQLDTPRAGWAEVDVETYWDALRQSMTSLWSLGDACTPERVVSLSISAQGETLVPVDASGAALRPAIVWLDNRAEAEAVELAAHFDKQHLYAVTGQPEMLPTWPATKLLWIARHEPHLAERTAKYLLIEDWLLHRLTGEYVTEGSLATSTCYWNFRTKQWWPEMLHTLKISEAQLPIIVEPGTPIGKIRAAAARDLGLPESMLVCAGGLDQACGAIGAGNVTTGGFSENTGAAIALCATVSAPTLDPRGELPCHYHALPDTYMLHTFTSGGIVLRWFRDRFCEQQLAGAIESGTDSYDLLAELAAGTPPGADGLIMLPHLQGAMAPENNPSATGVLVGLTLAHTRGHVVRAIMESIAFIVRRNVEAMAGLTGPIPSVRALGGGSRSPIWKQIEADVLDRPVITMRQPDAGTVGAAILAGVGAGYWSSVAEGAAATVREDRIYEPDQTNRGLYDDLYALYRDSYDALLGVFRQSSSLRAGSQGESER